MIDEVYVSDPVLEDQLLASSSGVRIVRIPEGDMERISQMTTPPGVFALCNLPPAEHAPASCAGQRLLYLDGIRDPGNLGTILRIADWFGLDGVWMSPDCVDPWNPKVLQSAMGSAFRVPAREMDHESLLAIREVRLYGCDGSGTPVTGMEPPAEGIFIFGNESTGISDELMEHVSDVLAVPRDRSLGAESLNVSTAVGILAAWWTSSV